MRNSIRAKKRTNARTVTIRTQWAKAHDPELFHDIDGILITESIPLKSNPNTACGFYIPTTPDNLDHDDHFNTSDLFDEFDEEFNTHEITSALYDAADTGKIADDIDEFFKDPEIVEYLTNLWNKENEEVLI